MVSKNKLIPKRFTDRKDCYEIINKTKNFTFRNHNTIPNWLYYFFAMMVIWYAVVLMLTSISVLREKSADIRTLYVVIYLLASFLIFSGFITYLVRKLKQTLNAVEFINLSVSRSLEHYIGAYCLLNKEGKIFYYNFDFSKNFMSSNDVEHKKYEELLNKVMFDDHALEIIKDSIHNNKTNNFRLHGHEEVEVNVFPLTRPEGVFALNIISHN